MEDTGNKRERGSQREGEGETHREKEERETERKADKMGGSAKASERGGRNGLRLQLYFSFCRGTD